MLGPVLKLLRAARGTAFSRPLMTNTLVVSSMVGQFLYVNPMRPECVICHSRKLVTFEWVISAQSATCGSLLGWSYSTMSQSFRC